MDEFIAFVIDGKRKANGEHEVDGEGRKITGVIKWLQGRGVQEAHFFNSAKGDNVQLFASTVLKPEIYERPWMKEIPGFEAMIENEGLLGITSAFAPIANLLASVKSNATLDDIFAQTKLRVDKIRVAFQTQADAVRFGEKEFMAALRGDEGTDSDAVFAEVERAFIL
jgi:hypothetical protein